MVNKVIWSKKALLDRTQIVEFWITNNKSNEYSIKLNKLFKEAIQLIRSQPKIGKKTDYKNTRIKVVKDYYLTYRFSKDCIEILAIWDCRQDFEKFKKILEV